MPSRAAAPCVAGMCNTQSHSHTHSKTHTTTLSAEDEFKFWLCLHRCCQTRFATPLSSCICQQRRQAQCHIHTHILAHTQSAQMNLKSRAKAFKSVAFVQANPYEVHQILFCATVCCRPSGACHTQTQRHTHRQTEAHTDRERHTHTKQVQSWQTRDGTTTMHTTRREKGRREGEKGGQRKLWQQQCAVALLHSKQWQSALILAPYPRHIHILSRNNNSNRQQQQQQATATTMMATTVTTTRTTKRTLRELNRNKAVKIK